MIDLIDTDRGFQVNKIIEGRVIRIDEESVLIDVGFKSEGSIPRHEWDENEDPPAVGDIVKVLVEEVDEEGAIARSQADAPEIDGLVHIPNGEHLEVGEFARVRVTDCDVHDLYAEVIE